MTFFVKHCYDDFAWFPLIEHFRLLWNSTLFCILPLKHQQKLCMNNSRVTQRIIDPLSSNIKRGWDSSNAIAGKHESRLYRELLSFPTSLFGVRSFSICQQFLFFIIGNFIIGKFFLQIIFFSISYILHRPHLGVESFTSLSLSLSRMAQFLTI